jgi:hypothetical protein
MLNNSVTSKADRFYSAILIGKNGQEFILLSSLYSASGHLLHSSF